MTDSIDITPPSPAGQAQRAVIHRLAVRAVRRRRRLRVGGRAAVGLLVLVLVMKFVWHPRPAALPLVRLPPLGRTPAVVIERIVDDPGLADRLAVRPRPPMWVCIGDAELLTALAQAGEPSRLEYGVDGVRIVPDPSGGRR